MGDRISIQFAKGDDISVALFSHWGGREFLNKALAYLKYLKEEIGNKGFEPLDRLEPRTVMVDLLDI